MDMATVLVTGFEPYGGRDHNPSFGVMRALDGRTIAGATVIGRGLPVSFAGLSGHIERLLDEFSPSAIVALGLCPDETMIRIERVAVNLADFAIPDNEDALLDDADVFAGAPVANFASLPVRDIETDLLAAAIPARLSMSAGTFLCNACLYGFLHALERKGRAIPCGFIHLPCTPDQVAASLRKLRDRRKPQDHQRGDAASMELLRMIRAVEIAIATTMRSSRRV